MIVAVDYRIDEEGYHVMRVVKVPACHTFGKSFQLCRDHMIQAVSLWFEIPEDEIEIAL